MVSENFCDMNLILVPFNMIYEVAHLTSTHIIKPICLGGGLLLPARFKSQISRTEKAEKIKKCDTWQRH
jgi:hypothetical protein